MYLNSQPEMRPAGIILASGLSSRMGCCKQLMLLNGKPLIRYSIETLAAANLSVIIITVIPEIEDTVNGIIASVSASLKKDKNKSLYIISAINMKPAKGQGYATALAVKKAIDIRKHSGIMFSGFLFCPADQPFLKSRSIQNLCTYFSKHPQHIVSASFGNSRCSPVIFPEYLKQELSGLDSIIGGRSVIQAHPHSMHLVPLEEKIEMFDIDTEDDMHIAEYILYANRVQGL